jgi:hypothetical protein
LLEHRLDGLVVTGSKRNQQEEASVAAKKARDERTAAGTTPRQPVGRRSTLASLGSEPPAPGQRDAMSAVDLTLSDDDDDDFAAAPPPAFAAAAAAPPPPPVMLALRPPAASARPGKSTAPGEMVGRADMDHSARAEGQQRAPARRTGASVGAAARRSNRSFRCPFADAVVQQSARRRPARDRAARRR